MARLPDDSPIRSQILPSVWAGYTLPRSEIMGEKLPSKGAVSSSNVPQEWMDEMFESFQNGSLIDFYDKYLGRSLTQKNHEEILLMANNLLKGNVRDLTLPNNPLILIAAMDIAHNANEYGHHLFQKACFLKEQDQLPKECKFIFWRKINPSLYDEKEFKIVQKKLSEQKVPQQWVVNAFYQWLEKDDSRDYQAHMQKISELEFCLDKEGLMPVERAVRDYCNRYPTLHGRPYHARQPRRGWRGYGE